VAFDPGGRSVLTGSQDHTAQVWDLPVPVPGGVERIACWVEVLTGMGMDRDGVARVLDASAWEERRQRLHELGGPPLP
jgi:hypothetical protein